MRSILNIGFFFLLLAPEYLPAQQLSSYSQFMFNDYILNPAVVGTKDYYQIRANSRFQWAGIVDAPQTVSFSVFGPHSSKDMGFGGYLINDVTGPTSHTGLYGSYAYNIALQNDIRLSMGLSFGILQNKVDGTKITLFEPNDEALKESVYASVTPDATIGLYAYGENWYAGFSAFQLFANSLKVYDVKNGLNKLKTHYFLMGGYTFYVNKDITVEPAVLVKKTSPVPMQININARVKYLKKVWLGAAFRSSDAVSIMVGYIHNEKYYFGYSYDIGLNDIRKYNFGSHEIMIGFRFSKIKNR